jgi:hypothetical protein
LFVGFVFVTVFVPDFVHGSCALIILVFLVKDDGNTLAFIEFTTCFV